MVYSSVVAIMHIDHYGLNYCILKKKLSYNYFYSIANVVKVEKIVLCVMYSKRIWV